MTIISLTDDGQEIKTAIPFDLSKGFYLSTINWKLTDRYRKADVSTLKTSKP